MLADGGVQIIAMRCAGYDRVDVHAAVNLGLKVVRVPIYSPASVAEHAVGMMFALNRYAAPPCTPPAALLLHALMGLSPPVDSLPCCCSVSQTLRLAGHARAASLYNTHAVPFPQPPGCPYVLC